MNSVHLYRHPQTADGIIGGSTDVAICPEKGLATMQRIVDHIVTHRVDMVIHTGLRRSQEVASTVHERCQSIELREIPEMKEIHLGAWEGKPLQLIRDRYFQGGAISAHAIVENTIEHAEPFSEFQARIRTGIQEILELAQQAKVAIIAHAISNRVVLSDIKGTEPASETLFQLHGCYNRIDMTNPLRCDLINDVSHLAVPHSQQ